MLIVHMRAVRTRYIAGCMTGTSLDGLDVVLAEITGNGLEMTARYLGMVSQPLGALSDVLRGLASGMAGSPTQFLRAARELGRLHAGAVDQLCRDHLSDHDTLAFVVAHGQTIAHLPDEGLSWQLFDPMPLVQRLQVPVCYCLRQSDLIAGGQGAPITPLADWLIYGQTAPDTLVVNLGGICNMTFMPSGGPQSIWANDVAPCNIIIDGAVRRLFPDCNYDRDGQIAVRGKSNAFAYDYLTHHFGPPNVSSLSSRSLGREDFDDQWIENLVANSPSGLTSSDIIASTVNAVGTYLANIIGQLTPRLTVLAGGGARHPGLVDSLRQTLRKQPRSDSSPPRIVLSDALGIPCEAREAMGFAVLGALSQDGESITLPQVTGAKAPGRAGTWVYP